MAEVANRKTYSDNEIFAGVMEILSKAFRIEECEIDIYAKLVADLGAESIDRLDLTFQIEKKFEIRCPRGEFLLEIFDAELMGQVQDGVLSPQGILLLKTKLPFMDLSEFEHNPSVKTFYDTINVDNIIEYVAWKQKILQT